MQDNDNILLAKMAIQIARQDEGFKDTAASFIAKNDTEYGYIQISNMLFPFYTELFETASSSEEKKTVIKNMRTAFNRAFSNKYLPLDCWEKLVAIREVHGRIQNCMDSVNELIDMLDKDKFPITVMYIYRMIANYLVSCVPYYKEPYTTMLEKVVEALGEDRFDPSEQPNYLS